MSFPNIISVHSHQGGTGVTSIALGLGIHFAGQGKRVLLIELNFLNPTLHNLATIDLMDIPFFFQDNLENDVDLDEIIIPSKFHNLDLILIDPKLINNDNSFDLEDFKKALLGNFKEYDIIILDEPFALYSKYYLNLGKKIFVIRPNSYSLTNFEFLLENNGKLIKENNGNSPILILNQMPDCGYNKHKINKLQENISSIFPQIETIIEIPYFSTCLDPLDLIAEDNENQLSPFMSKITELASTLTPGE